MNEWQERVSEAVRLLGQAAAELARGLAQGISDALGAPDFRWTFALKHSQTAHPEWVAIYERTKKRRTRKKYRDRIIREWERSVDQCPNVGDSER